MSDLEEGPLLIYPGPRAALLGRLGKVTLDELHALEDAVRDLAKAKELRGRVDRGFWYAWHDGLELPREEQAQIGDLFADVMMAIAGGVVGLDVERFGARLGARSRDAGGAFGGLLGFLRQRPPSQRRQEMAIDLINDAAAPWDPRLGVVACWNVACAAALRRRLRPPTVEALEAAWRTALGEPPA